MQEVYGKLEEPDGLAGLLRLRTGGPRLQDQVTFTSRPPVECRPCSCLDTVLLNYTSFHTYTKARIRCTWLKAGLHVLENMSMCVHMKCSEVHTGLSP